jgi:hypothetical protein
MSEVSVQVQRRVDRLTEQIRRAVAETVSLRRSMGDAAALVRSDAMTTALARLSGVASHARESRVLTVQERRVEFEALAVVLDGVLDLVHEVVDAPEVAS